MENEGTSIALLTMNKPDTLRATIDALAATIMPPYEMIVVDNGSTDPRTIAILDECIRKGWIVQRNEKNLGLSRGVNQGLALGSYDCLIRMDDDCVVRTKGWNQTLRQYLVKYPEIGMVIPTDQRPYIQHTGYCEISWGLGMVFAYRKSLYDDIGGYDPQLYHQNECDLALRVRMAGYRVAAIQDFRAIHNDPGGPKSDVAAAREHIGCVIFNDKWRGWFEGRDKHYGSIPLSRMQHWPPDQDFLRRFALQNGINLNPCPVEPRRADESFQEHWDRLDAYGRQQLIDIQGTKWLIWRALRNDYAHWEDTDAYALDRQKAIDRWEELTGERYTGYRWPINLLRPAE